MKKESAKPKGKKPARSYQDIEEERRKRKIEVLKKKFEATLSHMDEVAKINEECYKAKKELTRAAKTSIKREGKGRS